MISARLMAASAVMLVFMLVSLAPVRAAADVFDGVYFGVRAGALFPHNADESFVSSNSNRDGDVPVSRDADASGFAFHAAFGARLTPDFSDFTDFTDFPFWLRSELEIGLQRYGVESSGNFGGGTSSTVSIVWHNYLHPLDLHNSHQVWGGAGFGGSFVDTKLANGSGTAENGGANFIAVASIGYDYLVLERSRFSNEHLLLGVSYRFSWAGGFRQELGSEILLNLTYGF